MTNEKLGFRTVCWGVFRGLLLVGIIWVGMPIGEDRMWRLLICVFLATVFGATASRGVDD